MTQVRRYLRLGGDGMLRLSSLRLRRFLLREKREIISLEGQVKCAETLVKTSGSPFSAGDLPTDVFEGEMRQRRFVILLVFCRRR